MRIIQALAITVPTWVLIYFLLDGYALDPDDWQDLLVLIVLVLASLVTASLALLKCDMHISLKRHQEDSKPDSSSTRSNLANFFTGLAIGLLPTLIWINQLQEDREKYKWEAEGYSVVGARTDILPGDLLTPENLTTVFILRKNITDQHIIRLDLEKLFGTKAKTEIPGSTAVLKVQVSGVDSALENINNNEPKLMQNL